MGWTACKWCRPWTVAERLSGRCRQVRAVYTVWAARHSLTRHTVRAAAHTHLFRRSFSTLTFAPLQSFDTCTLLSHISLPLPAPRDAVVHQLAEPLHPSSHAMADDDFGFEADSQAEAEYSGNDISDVDSQLSHDDEPKVPAFKAQLPQPTKPAPKPAAQPAADDGFGFDNEDAEQWFGDKSGGGSKQQPSKPVAVAAVSTRSKHASARAPLPSGSISWKASSIDDTHEATLAGENSPSKHTSARSALRGSNSSWRASSVDGDIHAVDAHSEQQQPQQSQRSTAAAAEEQKDAEFEAGNDADDSDDDIQDSAEFGVSAAAPQQQTTDSDMEDEDDDEPTQLTAAVSNRSPRASARAHRPITALDGPDSNQLDSDDDEDDPPSAQQSTRSSVHPPAPAAEPSPTHSNRSVPLSQRSSKPRTPHSFADVTLPGVRITPKEGTQRSSRLTLPQSAAGTARLPAESPRDEFRPLSSHRADQQPSARASVAPSIRDSVVSTISAHYMHSTAILDNEREDIPNTPEMSAYGYADETEPSSHQSKASSARPADSGRSELPQPPQKEDVATDEEWPVDMQDEQPQEETAAAPAEEPVEDEQDEPQEETVTAADEEQYEDEPAIPEPVASEEPADEELYESKPVTARSTAAAEQATEEPADKPLESSDDYGEEFTVEQSVADSAHAETDDAADEQQSIDEHPEASVAPIEVSGGQQPKQQQEEKAIAAVDEEWGTDNEDEPLQEETVAAAEDEWYEDEQEEQPQEETAAAADDEAYEDEPATEPVAVVEQAGEQLTEEEPLEAEDEYADEDTVEQSVLEEQPVALLVDEQPAVVAEAQKPDESEEDYADDTGAGDELPEEETAAVVQQEEEPLAPAVPHIATPTRHQPKPSVHKPVTVRPGPEVEEEERPAEVHHEVDEYVKAVEKRRRQAEKSDGRKPPAQPAHKERKVQEVEEEQAYEAAHEEMYEDEPREEDEVYQQQRVAPRRRASPQRYVDVRFEEEEEVPEERFVYRSPSHKPANKRTNLAPSARSPSSSMSRTSLKQQSSSLLPHIQRSPTHSYHHSRHHSSDDMDQRQVEEVEEEADLTEYINQLEDQNRLLQTRVRSLRKKQSTSRPQSSLPTAIHGYSDRINELEHLLIQERQERRTVERTVKRLEKDLVAADHQRGQLPQVLERMTAEVGREKERARRLRELSDEKEREVRRMVLRALEMEKKMRVMERMLMDHRATMGRQADRAEEAREREEEGRIESEVQEYREQMRQMHGELTAHGEQRDTLRSTPMGRHLLRTLDQKQITSPKNTHRTFGPPPPVKRPLVPRQRYPVHQPPPPKKVNQRYGAPYKKPTPVVPPPKPTRASRLVSPTRGVNSRFPNVAAIKAELKRSQARADVVHAALLPRPAVVALPQPLKPAQLDRYPTHIPTLKANGAVAVSTVSNGKEGGGLAARAIGNGPSEAAPALAAVMASIAREEEEHRQMLQLRRDNQLQEMGASPGKKWKAEEHKEQLVEMAEEKTAVQPMKQRPAAIAPIKSARGHYGVIEDEAADEAVAADDDYGDDDFDG